MKPSLSALTHSVIMRLPCLIVIPPTLSALVSPDSARQWADSMAQVTSLNRQIPTRPVTVAYAE
jgi:hypothetical protein